MIQLISVSGCVAVGIFLSVDSSSHKDVRDYLCLFPVLIYLPVSKFSHVYIQNTAGETTYMLGAVTNIL